MLLPISYSNQPNFKANLNSPELRIRQKDFYIKIRGYGRNPVWAEQIKETADIAAKLIRKNTAGENVLKLITNGVIKANSFCLDIRKKNYTGILRTLRDDWKSQWYNTSIHTSYETGRYSAYKERLNKVCASPIKQIKKGLGMSRPNCFNDIVHGKSEYINNSLDHVFNLFQEKYAKFLDKDVKNEDLPEIIDVVAEIRWVLAHATPWMRGSDAISNVFMRAMFKAVGVKAYPPAKGISYDLEAYCRNLDDYKANFNSFFEKPPRVIE